MAAGVAALFGDGGLIQQQNPVLTCLGDSLLDFA
jgi:hypothetical protein